MKTINGWMDGWMDEWMDHWMDGWMDGWVNESLDGWVDVWVGGWVYGVSEFPFYVLKRIGTKWAGCRKEVPETQVMSLLPEILLSHLHTHSLRIGQLYAQPPVHSFSHSTHLFHHPFVPNP